MSDAPLPQPAPRKCTCCGGARIARKVETFGWVFECANCDRLGGGSL
jgi:hypothetical protein